MVRYNIFMFRLNLKVQTSPLKNPITLSVRYLRSNGQNNTLLMLELELLLERTFIGLLCSDKVNLCCKYTKCMFLQKMYNTSCKLQNNSNFSIKKCEI